MAYTVSQTVQGSAGAGSNTVSATLAALSGGELVIVALFYRRNNAGQDVQTVTVRDQIGNFYVPGTTALDMTTTFCGIRMFYAYNKVAGTPTITATFAGGAASGQVQGAQMLATVVTGWSAGPKFDVGHGAVQVNPGTGAGAISTGAATTTVNGDFVAAFCASNTGSPGTISAGSGWTARFNPGAGALGVYSEDQTQGTAGAITGTFTQSTALSSTWFSVVVAFADVAVTTSSRISQEALEVPRAGTTAARISQAALEVADQFTSGGGVRISQAALEVLYLRPVTTTVAISQLAVEVLHPAIPPATGRTWTAILG